MYGLWFIKRGSCCMCLITGSVYSQWGLSLAPALSRSLAMGTLLVMMAMSSGSSPSLLGVFKSSSSRLKVFNRDSTTSSSWCSTASNRASFPWNYTCMQRYITHVEKQMLACCNTANTHMHEIYQCHFFTEYDLQYGSLKDEASSLVIGCFICQSYVTLDIWSSQKGQFF